MTHRPRHIRNIMASLCWRAANANPRRKAAAKLRMAAQTRKWIAKVPVEWRELYMAHSVDAARELITQARIANLSAPSRLPS